MKKDILWTKTGDNYILDSPTKQMEEIPVGVYILHRTESGRFFLNKDKENFTFDYKLYGLETSFIKRVIRTYKETLGNLGLLLNGLKGTGKTVSAKIICNELKLPVIVVSANLSGCHIFLNSIPQDIVILMDEYEKTFEKSPDMLTIMDGAMNSSHRRVFILTTNELHVDPNLIERPSRIRYRKEFAHLNPQVVEEIIDDLLVHKQFKQQTIKFISTLEIISVDVVKAILQEINIHEEEPEMFKDVFNVRKLDGKFNILVKNGEEWEELATDVSVSPRPQFSDNHDREWFYINGRNIGGRVSKIINWNTIVITPIKDNSNVPKWFTEPLTVKVELADVYHYNYKYGDVSGFGTQHLIKEPKKLKKFSRDVQQPNGEMVAKNVEEIISAGPQGNSEISDCNTQSAG